MWARLLSALLVSACTRDMSKTIHDAQCWLTRSVTLQMIEFLEKLQVNLFSLPTISQSLKGTILN